MVQKAFRAGRQRSYSDAQDSLGGQEEADRVRPKTRPWREGDKGGSREREREGDRARERERVSITKIKTPLPLRQNHTKTLPI